uniref:Glycerol-3-phosphate dehydrogenase NAD-dependent C-terminal domain-containing protein n=1 Tax=Romanomermis culicivorax TaxID=13658 RepID=A0A915HTP5_ROMCU
MLISEEITSILNIPVSALMGANLAREVAHGDFCEATIGKPYAIFFKLLNKDLKDLEAEILKGQRLQGPHTAAQVIKMLDRKSIKGKDYLKEFPLFVAVHRICERQIGPKEMIECLRHHPSHNTVNIDGSDTLMTSSKLRFFMQYSEMWEKLSEDLEKRIVMSLEVTTTSEEDRKLLFDFNCLNERAGKYFQFLRLIWKNRLTTQNILFLPGRNASDSMGRYSAKVLSKKLIPGLLISLC